MCTTVPSLGHPSICKEPSCPKAVPSYPRCSWHLSTQQTLLCQPNFQLITLTQISSATATRTPRSAAVLFHGPHLHSQCCPRLKAQEDQKTYLSTCPRCPKTKVFLNIHSCRSFYVEIRNAHSRPKAESFKGILSICLTWFPTVASAEECSWVSSMFWCAICLPNAMCLGLEATFTALWDNLIFSDC